MGVKLRVCPECEIPFAEAGTNLTCSEECRQARIRRLARYRYKQTRWRRTRELWARLGQLRLFD